MDQESKEEFYKGLRRKIQDAKRSGDPEWAKELEELLKQLQEEDKK